MVKVDVAAVELPDANPMVGAFNGTQPVECHFHRVDQCRVRRAATRAVTGRCLASRSGFYTGCIDATAGAGICRESCYRGWEV
jgi:hypothetical protein